MTAGESEPRTRDRGRHRRRRSARRTAIDILYQADVLGLPPSSILEEWRAAGRSIAPYTAELVTGVERELAEIDRILGSHAEGWAVYRMAVVDRTILRLACYELRAGLPAAIAVNEAIEAANELSTEDSGRFINGILGRVVRETEAAADGREEREPVSPPASGRRTAPPRSRPPSTPS